jgi:hypothetical protein
MKKGINLTLQQANEHQLKHGFLAIAEKAKLPELKKGKQPNKTEAEFGRILESDKQRGKIIRYEYEGMTFRWLGMRYTPDWIVVCDRVVSTDPYCFFKAIEVKGGHIFDRDIVRFKGARALWPEIAFEMWQKKSGQWNRLH